jgi:hypothetical protein
VTDHKVSRTSDGLVLKQYRPNAGDLPAREWRSLFPADLIFIFGTLHWTPAELAAELYIAGQAPFIVTTGGPDRHPRRVSEAVVHQRLLAYLRGGLRALQRDTTNCTEPP